MYESNFGLHRQPFQCAEFGRAFFPSESIRSILPQLLHAMRSDLGVAVLTGPAGVGKTSLLKHLQLQLKHEGRAIMCSGASLETPTEILQTLHTASQLRAGEQSVDLSAASIACTRWAVVEQMRKTTEFWGPILLLIDDAHLMSVPVLNELRAFTEEDWNGRSLVRLLIAGPLSLEEELARPSQVDFSRRIRCHAFLQPLSSRESVAFLSRHIEVVGGKLNSIFSSDAVELITSASDGLPRCISLLADESLMVASQKSRKVADEECVRLALGHLQHLAYRWNASPLAPDERIENSKAVSPSGTHSQTMDQQSASTSHGTSSGVIEIGSPGVIEIGSGFSYATAATSASSATTPSATHRPAEVVAEKTLPTFQADGTQHQAFEVGHRYSPDTLEAADAVEMDAFDADAANSFSSSLQTAEQFADELCAGELSADNESPEPNVAEYAHQLMNAAASGAIGRKPQTTPVPAAELSSRVPVFDRYTWISLGREVPAGTYSVSSASDMQRVSDGLAGHSWDDRGSSDSAMSTTFDQIPIFDVSDKEISQLLQSRAERSTHGTFDAVKSHDTFSLASVSHLDDQLMAVDSGTAPRAPYVGVELFNPADDEPSTELNEQLPATPAEPAEFSEADREFIQNAIRSTLSKYLPGTSSSVAGDHLMTEAADSDAIPGSHDSVHKDQRSAWNDGQLLFNGSGTDALRDAISERVLNHLTEAMADGDNISFSFEAARAARDVQVSADQSDPTSDQPADKFFSLPENPRTVQWDLRSGLFAGEEIAPLADSLASLRDEVTSFQQTSPAETSRPNFDGLSEPISTGINVAGDSLVSRAKRRLDHENDAAAVRVTSEAAHLLGAAVVERKSASPRATGAAETVCTPLVHAAEQPSATSHNHNVPAGTSFSRLFTQLRKMRAQSTEN
jgi:type II secretory pathway predicted ATPase ExeA